MNAVWGAVKGEVATFGNCMAGAAKAAAFAKSKVPKIDVGAAKPCFVALGTALCKKAEKKACGRRRMIAIPAPVKNAMNSVWGAVKGEVATFGKCMAGAAKGVAANALKAALPTSAGSLLSMMGVRRLSIFGAIKSAAGKAASMAKGAACKIGGAKAEAACESAIKAGVAKAAAFAKSKVSKIDVGAAKPCFVALGTALCKKAEKKACGRRL